MTPSPGPPPPWATTRTAAARRASALATYTRLGASWWRDRLARLAAAEPDRVDALRLEPHRRRVLAGRNRRPRSVPVKALKGYSYLRELLRRPGIPVAAIDLVTGGAGTVEQPGLGSALDPSALESYRQRLKDLDTEIAEAEDWSDLARREALEAERDGPGGRAGRRRPASRGRQRAAGSSRERARVAATKALTTAIDRITAVDAISRPPPATHHPHRLVVHLPARRRPPRRVDPRLAGPAVQSSETRTSLWAA